jgi:hypothetical protein
MEKTMWPYDYKNVVNEKWTKHELMLTVNDCQNAQSNGYCDSEKWQAYQVVIKHCLELYNSKK